MVAHRVNRRFHALLSAQVRKSLNGGSWRANCASGAARESCSKRVVAAEGGFVTRWILTSAIVSSSPPTRRHPRHPRLPALRLFGHAWTGPTPRSRPCSPSPRPARRSGSTGSLAGPAVALPGHWSAGASLRPSYPVVTATAQAFPSRRELSCALGSPGDSWRWPRSTGNPRPAEEDVLALRADRAMA